MILMKFHIRGNAGSYVVEGVAGWISLLLEAVVLGLSDFDGLDLDVRAGWLINQMLLLTQRRKLACLLIIAALA